MFKETIALDSGQNTVIIKYSSSPYNRKLAYNKTISKGETHLYFINKKPNMGHSIFFSKE